MLNQNPKTYIRRLVKAVVGVTTYAVAEAVIKNNTADPENKAQKATLTVGCYVLASLAAAAAIKHVDARFDADEEDVKDVQDKVDENTQK
jgi:hypothetical protein